MKVVWMMYYSTKFYQELISLHCFLLVFKVDSFRVWGSKHGIIKLRSTKLFHVALVLARGLLTHAKLHLRVISITLSNKYKIIRMLMYVCNKLLSTDLYVLSSIRVNNICIKLSSRRERLNNPLPFAIFRYCARQSIIHYTHVSSEREKKNK